LLVVDSFYIQTNLKHTGTCHDVQGLAVRVAKREIADAFRYLDRADVLAVRRHNPYPTRTRAVDVPRLVDAHPIRNTVAGRACRVDEHATSGNRSIRLHFVTQDGTFGVFGNVQRFAVGGQRDSVGSRQIFNHKLQLVARGWCTRLLVAGIPDSIDTVE